MLRCFSGQTVANYLCSLSGTAKAMIWVTKHDFTVAWSTETLVTLVLQCSDNHHDPATCTSHTHTHKHKSITHLKSRPEAIFNHIQPMEVENSCKANSLCGSQQPTAAHILPCALSAAASELSVLVLPPRLQVAWLHSPKNVIPYCKSKGYHLIDLL